MSRILEARNRATPQEAASFVDEFDRLERDREEKHRALDAEFKAKKRTINKGIDADQKTILGDAKKQGVNKGVLRAISDGRKIKRKSERLLERAEEKIDALEADDREFALSIQEALGDFADSPLGAAAVAREDGGQDETTAAIVDAVRASASEEEWSGAAPKGDENVTAFDPFAPRKPGKGKGRPAMH